MTYDVIGTPTAAEAMKAVQLEIIARFPDRAVRIMRFETLDHERLP